MKNYLFIAYGDALKSQPAHQRLLKKFLVIFSENKNSKVYFEEYINNIINNRNKERYLSKNNQNIKGLNF